MLLSRLIILFLLVSNLAHCQDFLKKTLEEYFTETGSVIAGKIINNFNHEINNFQQVCPIEMLQKLKNPISLKTIIKKVI